MKCSLASKRKVRLAALLATVVVVVVVAWILTMCVDYTNP